MKNNKAYLPQNAFTRHEDFDAWYEDGDVFLSFKGSWATERDKVTVFGRMGGEMGCIKPDPKALTYYLKLERWEYVFHTLRLFRRYYVNGMKWMVEGSLTEPPLEFSNEESLAQEVRVKEVTFRDKGPCYEIKAKDVAKLRIAVAAVVALGIKEEYRGLSEGEKDPNASKLEKAKHWAFAGKGISYEQLLKQEEADGRSL